MVLNDYLRGLIANEQKLSSLFEWAQKLRQTGKEPIDLSIGNPNLHPPQDYYRALEELLAKTQTSKINLHGYVPNRGIYGAREKIATHLSSHLCTDIGPEQVFLTVGASNALDVTLRVVVEPVLTFYNGNPAVNESSYGEGGKISPSEVIIIAPYFLEYRNYIEKNQGRARIVFSDDQFRLDFDEIEENISRATKAVLLNSPNNPTGVVYREGELKQLARMLERKNGELQKTICVIEDAAYAQLLFGGHHLHSIMPHYRYTVLISSFSKSLGIAGERLGYIAVHPDICDTAEEWNALQQALSVSLRMTVVNAPVLQQRIIDMIGCETTIDVQTYERRVFRLVNALRDLGFDLVDPEGAFYIFARIPDQFADEGEFRKAVQSGDEPILYIPGYAFGGDRYNRYVRFSACVDDMTIDRACDRLKHICRHR